MQAGSYINNIGQAVRHRDVLFVSLCREYMLHGIQFLSLFFLCLIGAWFFSGFDTAWRSFDITIEQYFRDYNLFDIQLYDTVFEQDTIKIVKNLPGVERVRPRAIAELKRTDSAEAVRISVYLYDGPMDINTPRILEGTSLHPDDRRGCLAEKHFANAQGLKVGDTLRAELNGSAVSFVIRGLIQSPEFTQTEHDSGRDYAHFGYIYANKAAIPALPINCLLVKTINGTDIRDVQASLHTALTNVSQVDQSSYDPVICCRYFPDLFMKLTYLYPLIAFIVSAVLVTAMFKRLISEERINIGLLRALGYTNPRIIGHYVWYPLIPSFVGALLGSLTGRITLPTYLWEAISGEFSLPELQTARPSAISIFVFFAYIILTVSICIYVYIRLSEESEAALLKPKPPKTEKHILCERLPFIWKRMSVNIKTVIRNLSRDRGRTLVSILTISACNMLLVCAFCLNDSIENTAKSQYGGVFDYDYRIELLPDQASSIGTYRQQINAKRVEGIMEKYLELGARANSKKYLISVLEPGQQSVRLGPGGTNVPLPDDGIVISRKLAESFGIGLGDDITVISEDHGAKAVTKVRMIIEMNIAHGAFMSRSAWKELHIGENRPNVLLVSGITRQSTEHTARLKECDRIIPISEEYRDTMNRMSPTTVAFAVIGAAALCLTFLICFNMSRLKFMEHRREYVILRTLGYRGGEIIKQIMGSALVIGMIGTLLGFFPGMYLTGLILELCEHEYIVFAPCTPAASVVAASLITFIFSLLIELIYAQRVRYINMAEVRNSFV